MHYFRHFTSYEQAARFWYRTSPYGGEQVLANFPGVLPLETKLLEIRLGFALGR